MTLTILDCQWMDSDASIGNRYGKEPSSTSYKWSSLNSRKICPRPCCVMNSTPLKIIFFSFLLVFWTKFESKDILENLPTHSTLKYKLLIFYSDRWYMENWKIQLYIAKPGMTSLFRSTDISIHLPHLSMHA